MAGARIVAADFRTGADGPGFFNGGGGFADNVAALGRSFGRRGLGAGIGSRGCATKGAGRLMTGLLRDITQEVLEGHETRGAAENVMADLRFDVNHQLLENLERLGLVLDERITLAMRAQADAVTQTVHLIEMLLPELIDGAENDITLNLFESVGILVADLEFIGFANLVTVELE